MASSSETLPKHIQVNHKTSKILIEIICLLHQYDAKKSVLLSSFSFHELKESIQMKAKNCKKKKKKKKKKRKNKKATCICE